MDRVQERTRLRAVLADTHNVGASTPLRVDALSRRDSAGAATGPSLQAHVVRESSAFGADDSAGEHVAGAARAGGDQCTQEAVSSGTPIIGQQPADLSEPPRLSRVQEVLGPNGPRLSYIGGAAGTGKTFAIREAAAADPGVLLTAVTGIAACNLGESVTTINSLLHYFDLEDLNRLYTTGALENRLVALASSGCKRIVIDEVSMMDGRQLYLILQSLEIANDALERNGKQPIGLTLTGDFLQLPPVDVAKLGGRADTKKNGKFAFDIPTWAKFETVLLTKIRRQADPLFIGALREARRGNGRGAAEVLRTQCHPFADDDFNGTTLVARNNSVDEYNMKRMLKLAEPDHHFEAELTGKPRAEWKNIPMTLELRKGALVMILANCSKRSLGMDEDGYEYVNGDLGVFLEPTPGGHGAVVKLHRTGETVNVIYVTRQNLAPCPAERFKLLAASEPHKLKGNYEIVGVLDYMPLRAAWASTVHKAQGLSLDNVQVDLRDGFYQTAGMCYVALTRCRTLQGLRIVGSPELLAARCVVDERVRRWL